MRHLLRSPLLLAVATAALTLSGCGSDTGPGEAQPPVDSTPTASPTPSSGGSGEPSPSLEPTPTQDPDTVTIDLTVRGNSIEPGPKVVKVKRGKPVVFLIDSDRPGGLHVHSSPEQTPEFKAGQSKITITLDKPGVVEVEEHEADALVAQLEVR